MHGNITHNQEGKARNCGKPAWPSIYFGRWCIGGQARCDGETNLPKAAELRRFIAGNLRTDHRKVEIPLSSRPSSSSSTVASLAGRGAAAIAGSIIAAQCSGAFAWLRNSP